MKPQPIANPPNPWASHSIEYLEEIPKAELEVYEDATETILSKNDSPDLGFSYSVNPYRGCQHACAYCYARPSHEYLSFGSGTDFDSKIMVKSRAPELLKHAFEKPSWKGEVVMFSGVTDCYQPLEASLEITRKCLEVCAQYKNPVGIITKAPLVERDLDILQQLNKEAGVMVAVSIPIWDKAISRAIEPGVATPQRRIGIIQKLASAGISVHVMVAPIIPGLSEDGLSEVLRAAKDAGAQSANYVLLRLPGSVQTVFSQRLQQVLPLRAEKILHRIRETRGGKLYDARFGVRGRGVGEYAQAIEQLFEGTAKRMGFQDQTRLSGASTFHRPSKPQSQLSLF